MKELTKLYQMLVERFDANELRTLCFHLGKQYDDLPGEGKVDKARELISYLERRDRIPELIEVGKRLRPDIPWGRELLVSNQGFATRGGISPLMKSVGFTEASPVNFKEYYYEERFLRAPFHPNSLIYHVEVFRNTEGLDRSNFNFVHQNSFQIYHPTYAVLERKVADGLPYNETRLRITETNWGEIPLEIRCQRGTYSQVLVTNHSDELSFQGERLREVFAPSVEGKLPLFEDSLATNPAGCNCLLKTNDGYFVIQRRSREVETSVLQLTPSISGGVEYERVDRPEKLDPFEQLFKEMAEEIGFRKDHLVREPLLLAISRDVQRNGLPEFFFYAQLGMDFDQVEHTISKKRAPDSHEHKGILPLRAQETEIVDCILNEWASLALRANLAYYLMLLDVVREW